MKLTAGKLPVRTARTKSETSYSWFAGPSCPISAIDAGRVWLGFAVDA